MTGDPQLEEIRSEISSRIGALSLEIPSDQASGVENLADEVRSAGEEERIGKLEQFQKCIEKLLKGLEGDKVMLQIRALATYAGIHFEMGNYKQALDTLDDAIIYSYQMGDDDLVTDLDSIKKAIEQLMV